MQTDSSLRQRIEARIAHHQNMIAELIALRDGTTIGVPLAVLPTPAPAAKPTPAAKPAAKSPAAAKPTVASAKKESIASAPSAVEATDTVAEPAKESALERPMPTLPEAELVPAEPIAASAVLPEIPAAVPVASRSSFRKTTARPKAAAEPTGSAGVASWANSELPTPQRLDKALEAASKLSAEKNPAAGIASSPGKPSSDAEPKTPRAPAGQMENDIRTALAGGARLTIGEIADRICANSGRVISSTKIAIYLSKKQGAGPFSKDKSDGTGRTRWLLSGEAASSALGSSFPTGASSATESATPSDAVSAGSEPAAAPETAAVAHAEPLRRSRWKGLTSVTPNASATIS